MSRKWLWAGICFLVILDSSLQQQVPCDPNTVDALDMQAQHQKRSILSLVRDKHYFMRELYDLFFVNELKKEEWGTDPKSLLLWKYERDLDGIENAFKVKMQIVNESRNIKNIIDEQKNNLRMYYDLRWNEYTSFTPFPYPYLEELRSQYEQIVMANGCIPCTDIRDYSTCLQREVNSVRQKFDAEMLDRKNYVEKLKTLDNVKPWEFVNKARRALEDIFKSLNKSITTQQVKDYYRPKVVSLYRQVLATQESDHDGFRTSSFMSGAGILVKILQFVIQKYKKHDLTPCIYVGNINTVIKLLSFRLSPYQRVIIDDIEGIAAKYIRPIDNITDVDLLIKVLEDTIRAGKEDAYPNSSDSFNTYPSNLIRTRKLFEDISEYIWQVGGLCTQSVLVDELGSAAYQTYVCYSKFAAGTRRGRPYFLEDYKQSYAVELENCYNKTLTV